VRGGAGCLLRTSTVRCGSVERRVTAAAGRKDAEKGTQVSDEATKKFLQVRPPAFLAAESAEGTDAMRCPT